MQPIAETFRRLIFRLRFGLSALAGICLLGGGVMAYTSHHSKPSAPIILQPVAQNTSPTNKNHASQPTTSTPTPTSASPTTTQNTPPKAVATPPKAVSTPVSAPVAANPSTPQSCTKGTYSPASSANTPQPGGGLQQIIDAAQHYTVYGSTANQIRAQLNLCSPVSGSSGEFDAETNWWVRFSYYWHSKPNGLCALNGVGVVLHVTFIFPQWLSSNTAASGLGSQWQTYLNNLTTHENGHRDIAIQFATKLYNDLQNYPDTSCSTISQSATNYGNNLLASLNQYEDNYDTQTNHGATQGATFP